MLGASVPVCELGRQPIQRRGSDGSERYEKKNYKNKSLKREGNDENGVRTASRSLIGRERRRNTFTQTTTMPASLRRAPHPDNEGLSGLSVLLCGCTMKNTTLDHKEDKTQTTPIQSNKRIVTSHIKKHIKAAAAPAHSPAGELPPPGSYYLTAVSSVGRPYQSSVRMSIYTYIYIYIYIYILEVIASSIIIINLVCDPLRANEAEEMYDRNMSTAPRRLICSARGTSLVYTHKKNNNNKKNATSPSRF
eukprot:gene1509-894_t